MSPTSTQTSIQRVGCGACVTVYNQFSPPSSFDPGSTLNKGGPGQPGWVLRKRGTWVLAQTSINPSKEIKRKVHTHEHRSACTTRPKNGHSSI